MKKILLLAAMLGALAGSSAAQTQAKPPAAPISAGEAADAQLNIALGKPVANPGAFQMRPVTQKVDISDAMMLAATNPTTGSCTAAPMTISASRPSPHINRRQCEKPAARGA